LVLTPAITAPKACPQSPAGRLTHLAPLPGVLRGENPQPAHTAGLRPRRVRTSTVPTATAYSQRAGGPERWLLGSPEEVEARSCAVRFGRSVAAAEPQPTQFIVISAPAPRHRGKTISCHRQCGDCTRRNTTVWALLLGTGCRRVTRRHLAPYGSPACRPSSPGRKAYRCAGRGTMRKDCRRAAGRSGPGGATTHHPVLVQHRIARGTDVDRGMARVRAGIRHQLTDQLLDHRVERLHLSGRSINDRLVSDIIISYWWCLGRLSVAACGDGLTETGWLQPDG
jgi:hypothetical protein